MTILGTRTILLTLAIGALALVMTGLSPAILAATAATVALGAVIAPIFGLAAIAALVFTDQMNIVGTSANNLLRAFAAFKAVLITAFGPASNVLFDALVQVLSIITPMAQALAPVFTVFAHALAGAMLFAANALAGMEPIFAQLLTTGAPALGLLAQAGVLLLEDLLKIAVYGMPVLMQILQWFVDLARWLGPAIDDMDKFTRSSLGVTLLNTTLTILVQTALFVARVVSDLAGIAYQLYVILLPLEQLIGGALLTGLNLAADALDLVNGHMGSAAPLILAAATAFVAFRVAVVTWTTAVKVALALQRGWMVLMAAFTLVQAGLTAGTLGLTVAWVAMDAAMQANVIGLIIGLIAALVIGIIYAYHHSELFRNIVNGLWQALKAVGIWAYNAGIAVKDFLAGAFDWVSQKAQALYDKLKPIISAMKTVAKFSPLGLAAKGGNALAGALGVHARIPFFADGGNVVRGGAGIVGDRGPELLDLPDGARVTPLEDADTGGDVIIPITFMADGEVLTKIVHRHQRKKRSVR
jgi:hypothetical protein